MNKVAYYTCRGCNGKYNLLKTISDYFKTNNDFNIIQRSGKTPMLKCDNGNFNVYRENRKVLNNQKTPHRHLGGDDNSILE